MDTLRYIILNNSTKTLLHISYDTQIMIYNYMRTCAED